MEDKELDAILAFTNEDVSDYSRSELLDVIKDGDKYIRLLVAEIKAIRQAITDPENQPSQFGTVIAPQLPTLQEQSCRTTYRNLRFSSTSSRLNAGVSR